MEAYVSTMSVLKVTICRRGYITLFRATKPRWYNGRRTIMYQEYIGWGTSGFCSLFCGVDLFCSIFKQTSQNEGWPPSLLLLLVHN